MPIPRIKKSLLLFGASGGSQPLRLHIGECRLNFVVEILPSAFNRYTTLVANFLQCMEVGTEIIPLSARGGAFLLLGDVTVPDKFAILHNLRSRFVFPHHVVYIAQQLHVWMVHSLHNRGTLFQGINQIGLTSVQRFNQNRYTVLLCQWSNLRTKIHKLFGGPFFTEVFRHIACFSTAQNNVGCFAGRLCVVPFLPTLWLPPVSFPGR